jgi:4-amino-4-deoxy-L-arabinose transferase-like glycosyltransferase
MKRRIVAWLILLLGIAWSRGGFLENIIYNVDEAEYAVAADALNHDWLPGVDLLGSTKPPAIAFLFNLLFHSCGHSLAVLHVAHLVMMILLGWLVMELAAVLWGKPALIPAALFFWIISSSYSIPSETLALNVESPGTLLACLSVLLAWRYPQSWAAFAASGIAFGAAVMFRQSLAFFFLPVVAGTWLLSARRWQNILIIIGGAVLSWLPVIWIYAAAGGLAWVWDSWVRYPFTYASDVGFAGFFQAGFMTGMEFVLQLPVAVAMAVGGAILLCRARRERSTVLMAWLLLTSVLAVCSGSRFFGHYWIQIFPVLSLLAVPAWLMLSQGRKQLKWLLALAVGVGAIIALLHFPAWHTWDRNAPPRGQDMYCLGKENLQVSVGQFAREHTRPDETIVVWGYCPQIYWYAQRLPGVRDYLCQYATGYSVGAFDPAVQTAPRPFGHPLAQRMFIEDIERRKPKYIFDLVPVDDYVFTFVNFSLRNYPDLAAYLRQNYLPEGKIGRVPIYRRRMPEDAWWPSAQDIQ